MLRCIRIHTDNCILEKTLDTRGGHDQVRRQVAALLRGLDLAVEEAALALDDNWSRGHIRISVTGEVTLEKLEHREGLVVLSVRHDFKPGPQSDAAAPPAAADDTALPVTQPKSARIQRPA